MSDGMNKGRACVFCEIVAGRLPAAIVHRDDRVVAFLDARPLFPGHVLVVPAAHVETLPELPAELIEPLFGQVQIVTAAVERAMSAAGSFVALNNRVSQSVPHLHVHVVPRNKGDGLKGFFWPRHDYASDEAREAARAAIAEAIVQLSVSLAARKITPAT